LNHKFGSGHVLVLGKWFAPNTKYQEPTRNKCLIQMLKKKNVVLYVRVSWRAFKTVLLSGMND
ncbi:hypothetical protein BD408DRAFT_334693, partial [Parasitella parasitica]